LDSAGFGTLTISKSISVVCNGVVAGVLAAGTTGFTINTASTDHVVLDGMDIEGFGTGTHGLNVVGSGAIFIRNSSIRHFTGNGVNVAGTAGARVMVDNVLIVNNAGGVNVQGAAGAANSASVTHSFIDGNASFGVQASGSVNSLAIGWDVISNSPTAISALSSAQVVSFGPSSIVTGAGVPTSTPAFK
jgi:hypothetical protein